MKATVLSTTKNSPSAIAIQYAEYRRAWWPVLLFLPGRLVFALFAQAIAAAMFALQGSLTAWHDAAAWWPVYSTITDVLCLAALVLLTRREGMTLLDLFGVQSFKSAVRQLAWIPPYMLAVLPTVAVASVVTQAFYDSPVPPIVSIVDLPASAAVYARLAGPSSGSSPRNLSTSDSCSLDWRPSQARSPSPSSLLSFSGGSSISRFR